MPSINISGGGGGGPTPSGNPTGGATPSPPPPSTQAATGQDAAADRTARARAGAEKSAEADRLRIEKQIDAMARRRERADAADLRAQQRLFEKQQRAAESAARRRDPTTYLRDGIEAIGRRGASAAGSSDFARAVFSQRRLDGIEKRIRAQSVTGGLSGPQADTILGAVAAARGRIRGGAMLSELAGGAGIGRVAGWAAVAADAAKTLWNAPDNINAATRSVLSGARPYTDIVRGASDLGGAGGFNGRSLADTLTSANVPAWRQRLGVTAADILTLNSEYGPAARSPKEAEAIAQDVAEAAYAPGLQGLGRDRLAAAAGDYETLAGANGGSRADYFKRLEAAMQSAVARGVDRSRAMATLARMGEATASAGGAVNAGPSFDYAARLMAFGNSSMRSGAGIAEAQGGTISRIKGLGYGGDTVATMTVLAAGVPKSAADLEGIIGRKRDDLAPGEQRIFDLALDAAKSGSAMEYASLVSPLMVGDQGQASYRRLAHNYAGRMGLRNSTAFLVESSVSGAGANAVATDQAAGTWRPSLGKGGRGWADLPPAMQRSVADAASRNGVDPALLAGLLSYESGFRPRPSGTGANGYGQVTAGTFADAKSRGLLDGFNYGDVSDPDKGPEIAARILRWRIDQGGSTTEGLRRYHGLAVDKNGVGPDDYAASVTKRESLFSNMPVVLNTAGVNQDQSEIQAGRRFMPGLDAMAEFGGSVVKLDSGVANFAGSVERFATAVARFSGYGAIPGAPAAASTFQAPRGPHAVPVHGGVVATP